MSFIGGLFSGSGGSNFQAQNPVSQQDLANSKQYLQQSLSDQQKFANAVAAQNGLGNQSSVFNQQQQLANQLAAQSQGAGPNPALDQLNQATGQNVSNQAALMASQRGAGANAGLIARQAAMQGANTQQQAVGQAATMRANQQLAAQNELQQQQSMMGNLAGTQVGQQQQALGQMQASALANQGQQFGAIQGANSANSQIQAGNQQFQGNTLGGALSGVGSMAANLGGKLLGFADGGMVPVLKENYEHSKRDPKEPKSFAIRHLKGFANGGDVKAPVIGSKLAAEGERVPGKAKVEGNSYSNDTVPAMLSPGEVVLPREVMNHKNPAAAAAAFVKNIIEKKQKGK
jgi:hypothetical protein